MSTPEHIDDDKLQRFYDGELTEGEALVVGRDVDASELEQARLAQLERLGEVLRAGADAEAETIDSDALFLRIERGIEAEPVPRLRLVEGRKKRQRTGAVIAVAVAIAAAVMVTFLLQQPPTEELAENPMDDPRQLRADIDDLPPVHLEPPGGSAVELVEFGANTGTVFAVEGDEGQPLAVVWIAEE